MRHWIDYAMFVAIVLFIVLPMMVGLNNLDAALRAAGGQ